MLASVDVALNDDIVGVHQVCQASCVMLTTSDYLDLLWTTLAELPGWYFFVS